MSITEGVNILSSISVCWMQEKSEPERGQTVISRGLDQSTLKATALAGCSWSTVVSVQQKWSNYGKGVNRTVSGPRMAVALKILVHGRGGDRTFPQSVTPALKYGGGSVKVWGCFGGSNTVNQNPLV